MYNPIQANHSEAIRELVKNGSDIHIDLYRKMMCLIRESLYDVYEQARMGNVDSARIHAGALIKIIDSCILDIQGKTRDRQ